MSVEAIDLRDAVYTAIDTKKTLGSYFSFNTFQIQKAYQPSIEIEDLKLITGGKVYLIAGPWDESLISRNDAFRIEVMCRIGYQRIVDPDDVTTLDTLVRFVSRLKDCCREETSMNYASWSRNECLKDPNGTPYVYERLRQHRCFEYYFDTYWWLPKQRTTL